MTGKFREQVFLLGPRRSHVGILTEPAVAVPGRPAIVLLNAGIIHRVGPGRMSVLLARTLAARGHTVLRFDLSGIGDSPPRADGLAPVDGAMADIREALDGLESARGFDRVVLMGLCSGADHSLVYAGQDPRVVGLALFDPSTPRTRRYYFHHYLPRLFRPKVWYNVIAGRNARVRRLAANLFGSERGDAAARPNLQSPEVHAVLEAGYREALAQGVQFLIALTSGVEDRHNYREQVLDAFPRIAFGERLRLEYLKGVDHTFSTEAQRGQLFRLVTAWLEGTAFRAATQPDPEDEAAGVEFHDFG